MADLCSKQEGGWGRFWAVLVSVLCGFGFVAVWFGWHFGGLDVFFFVGCLGFGSAVGTLSGLFGFCVAVRRDVVVLVSSYSGHGCNWMLNWLVMPSRLGYGQQLCVCFFSFFFNVSATSVSIWVFFFGDPGKENPFQTFSLHKSPFAAFQEQQEELLKDASEKAS